MMSENILHIGLCLPKSCSNDEIGVLIQKLFDDYEFETLREYEIKPKVLDVKTLKFSPRFLLKKSVWFFVLLIFLAAQFSKSAKKLERTIKLDENNNVALGMEHKIELSSLEKMIRCFNYEQNKMSLRPLKASNSSVKSISGLR